LYVLTLAAAKAADTPNPISVSIFTLIVELFLFLLMVYLMERLVFSPIRKAWRERDAAIQAGLQASTDTRAEAEKARDEVRRILTDARLEAQSTIDAITAEGQRYRAQQVEQAQAEFNRLVQEARDQIEAERAQAASTMKDLIVDLALEAASKVTGRTYADQETRRIAASVIESEGALA
jgi:F-type H+-transporting ATPase subunit b